ncbi:unnamed protein product, partial [Coregonus sp. 'balchen']
MKTPTWWQAREIGRGREESVASQGESSGGRGRQGETREVGHRSLHVRGKKEDVTKGLPQRSDTQERWLPVALCLSCLVLSTHGQDRASLRRSNDNTGRCQYTFTVDNPAEASCPGARGGPEMEGVVSSHTTGGPGQQAAGRRGSRGRGATAGGDKAIQEVYSQAMGEKSPLHEDKEQLNRQVQELQRRVDELSVEAETLRQTPCHQSQAAGAGLPLHKLNQSPASGDEGRGDRGPCISLIQEAGQNHTGCGELVSVGEPVLHRKADSITGKYGTLWRIDTVGKDVRQLFAYEDMEQFAKGFPMKVLVLPVPMESTGATLYRDSLYCATTWPPRAWRPVWSSPTPAYTASTPTLGVIG